ncbi:MAG: hypothetical protein FGM37_08915 [Phycisphaerales bacterium]|nr:hypothetical protein [Phycisphaerales bacterium]
MNGYRVTAIVFGALMMGVVTFAAVAAVVVSTGAMKPAVTAPANPDAQAGLGPVQVLAIVAVLAVLSAVPMAFVMRARTLANASTPATARWNTAHIIAGAILEGAGLMCCAFALVTGHLEFLAGAGLMLAAMGVLFPTPARAELWAAEVADLRP